MHRTSASFPCLCTFGCKGCELCRISLIEGEVTETKLDQEVQDVLLTVLLV